MYKEAVVEARTLVISGQWLGFRTYDEGNATTHPSVWDGHHKRHWYKRVGKDILRFWSYSYELECDSEVRTRQTNHTC